MFDNANGRARAVTQRVLIEVRLTTKTELWRVSNPVPWKALHRYQPILGGQIHAGHSESAVAGTLGSGEPSCDSEIVTG